MGVIWNWSIGSIGVAFASMLVGCGMGNYSNPTLAITSADVRGDRAVLDVEVTNSSDFDLTLTSIDYTLTYGMFPVGGGLYERPHLIPSGESATMQFPVRFESSPVGPDGEVELSGEMKFEDTSNSGKMKLDAAAFTATATASAGG